ncbi:metallophosphoesterase [Sinobaca sp. H24]|uniref:metallophosphoesterase family protein n=1 Tax=Sinobaca sp. H24 TaxID=2923376 RepID=UPI00207974BA|nr:YfcE family phosphodiesterase [Sinobaca sp. H24]
MKIAVLSDVHGNARALKSVLRVLAEQKIDKMYIIGDLSFRGPEPKNALETIRSTPAKVLKGNADEWITRGIKKGEVPDKALGLMNQERDWALERLTEEDLAYLEKLPTSFLDELEDGIVMHAFHAVPSSLFEVVPADADDEEMLKKLASAEEADIYIYGHIHTPFVRKIGAKTIINTGSIGLPFDGDPRPSFALIRIENGQIDAAIERVEYDKTWVMEQYDAGDYPNKDQMKNIIKTGKKPK